MGKYWNSRLGNYIESPTIDSFVADIIAVCEKHKLWLSHEDTQGAFKVVSTDRSEWLKDIQDNRHGQ